MVLALAVLSAFVAIIAETFSREAEFCSSEAACSAAPESRLWLVFSKFSADLESLSDDSWMSFITRKIGELIEPAIRREITAINTMLTRRIRIIDDLMESR